MSRRTLQSAPAAAQTPCSHFVSETHRRFAAEWKRVRDSRRLAARMVCNALERAQALRVAELAHRKYTAHLKLGAI